MGEGLRFSCCLQQCKSPMRIEESGGITTEKAAGIQLVIIWMSARIFVNRRYGQWMGDSLLQERAQLGYSRYTYTYGSDSLTRGINHAQGSAGTLDFYHNFLSHQML